MKFFLDTEFIESGPSRPLQLISIGIVSESGKRYYAISHEFDPTTASDWVKTNVIEKLERDVIRLSRSVIANEVQRFVQDTAGDEAPEFWGYYADYDWVIFAQLFGTMMDLPSGFPMFCMDLKQLAVTKGNPQLPAMPEGAEHNALNDAEWNRAAWQFLDGIAAMTLRAIFSRDKAREQIHAPVSFEALCEMIADRVVAILSNRPAMPTRNEPVQATRKRALPQSSEDDPQRAKHCDEYWAYLVAASEGRARRKRDGD